MNHIYFLCIYIIISISSSLGGAQEKAVCTIMAHKSVSTTCSDKSAQQDSFLQKIEATKTVGTVNIQIVREILSKFRVKKKKLPSGHIGIRASFMQGKHFEPNFDQPQYVEQATQQYKIHLMPKIEDIPHIIYQLLKEAQERAEFGSSISRFKFTTSYKNLLEAGSTDRYVPLIVIYAGRKSCAQLTLNYVYSLFGGLPSSGYIPRFSKKVTDLIWFAQGSGDHKSWLKNNNKQLDTYYEKPEWVYFKPDVLGSTQDYHLVHPVTKKRL